MQLKWSSPFLIQGYQPITIKGRDFSQSLILIPLNVPLVIESLLSEDSLKKKYYKVSKKRLMVFLPKQITFYRNISTVRKESMKKYFYEKRLVFDQLIAKIRIVQSIKQKSFIITLVSHKTLIFNAFYSDKDLSDFLYTCCIFQWMNKSLLKRFVFLFM